MDADTNSYLRAVRQYRIHRCSLEVNRGPGVFDDLISEGFINLDEYGYFSLTRKGECLKNLLEKYKERFKRAAPRQVEQFLREKASVGYR
jgi:hypothetical protein